MSDDALALSVPPDLVEAIACRVVELLRKESNEAVSAAEIARRFDVSRDWVYANAEQLGAVRIGTGKRPRLRFYPDRVRRYLDACSVGSRSVPAESPDPKPRRANRRRRSNGQRTDLLPIRGEVPR